MTVYDFKVKNIKGQEIALSDYSGKLLLICDGAVLARFEPTVTPEELDPILEAAL